MNAVTLCLVLSLPAELVVAPPAHDAGPLFTGHVLRTSFTLSNPSRDPIHVLGAKPGCGCLRLTCPPHILSRGESMTMNAEIHTVTQPAGPAAWRATVSYRVGSSPDVHTAAVDIRASLTARLSLSPASLVLHTSGETSHALTLVEHLAKPTTVTGVEVGSGTQAQVTVGDARSSDNAWTRTLTLTTLKHAAPGVHEEMLRVHTSDAGCPLLCVPVTIVRRAASGLASAPARLSIDAPAGAHPPARILLLSSADDSAVKLTRVETTHPALRCTFAAGPGNRATVRVVADAEKMPATSFTAKVRIFTTSGDTPTLEVPVSVSR